MYKVQNNLTIPQHTTGFAKKGKSFMSKYSTVVPAIVFPR